MFNHIRYYHNCSTAPTIQNLISAGFKLNTNKSENLPKLTKIIIPNQIIPTPPVKPIHGQITLTFSSSKKCVKSSSNSHKVDEKAAKYDCPVCQEELQDYGGHLCFEHDMVKCRIEGDCASFFEDVTRRNLHEAQLHQRKQHKCSVCGIR